MGFLNSKIIAIFITVSLFLDSTVYGADVIDIRTLRIPLSGNRERITDIYKRKVPSRVNNILDRLKFNKTEKQLREWARSVAIEDLTQERDKIEELRSFYKRLLSNPAISEEVKNSIKRRDRIATAIIIFIEIMNKYSEISKENIQEIIEDTDIKDIDKKYRLELFETLSESGERTGKPVISTIAHLKGTAHTTSNVLVFKKDGRSVLLQLRTPDKASFPSRWTLSWCGHAK